MYKRPYAISMEYTTPTGVKTTLYSICALADKIGRSSQSVRKWEVAGLIPTTPFKKGTTRMYTIAQINCVYDSAVKSRIKTGKRMTELKFSSRIYKGWEELHKHYFTEINPKFEMEEIEEETRYY